MTIGSFTLQSNEEILTKASWKKIRPFHQLVLWAKVFGEWEHWDFSISRWPQYLEAHYVYGCMLLRPGLENIILALFPFDQIIPETPDVEQSPALRMKKGLWADHYMTQKGF